MESNYNISDYDKKKMLHKLKLYKYGVFAIGILSCVVAILLFILSIVFQYEIVVYFIELIMLGIGVAAIIEGVKFKIDLELEKNINEIKKTNSKNDVESGDL